MESRRKNGIYTNIMKNSKLFMFYARGPTKLRDYISNFLALETCLKNVSSYQTGCSCDQYIFHDHLFVNYSKISLTFFPFPSTISTFFSSSGILMDCGHLLTQTPQSVQIRALPFVFSVFSFSGLPASLLYDLLIIHLRNPPRSVATLFRMAKFSGIFTPEGQFIQY